MVIDWSRPGGDNVQIKPPKVRAAQYVRMSTEHQKYSTDNQSDAIQRYADRRGYEIVRTCADKGKSGLNLGGRAALQLLLDDIENGRADYAEASRVPRRLQLVTRSRYYEQDNEQVFA